MVLFLKKNVYNLSINKALETNITGQSIIKQNNIYGNKLNYTSSEKYNQRVIELKDLNSIQDLQKDFLKQE